MMNMFDSSKVVKIVGKEWRKWERLVTLSENLIVSLFITILLFCKYDIEGILIV